MTHDRPGFYPDAMREEFSEYPRPSPSSPTDRTPLKKAQEIVGARVAPLDKARATTTGSSTTCFAGPIRGAAGSTTSFLCSSRAISAANAPTSTRSVSCSSARRGCPHATSSASTSLTRKYRNRWESQAISPCRRLSHRDLHRGEGLVPGRLRRCAKGRARRAVSLDSDKVKAPRERLFASSEMNWVRFNYAGDLTLPGRKDGRSAFLCNPTPNPGRHRDSLDPTSFAYAISSKEIAQRGFGRSP